MRDDTLQGKTAALSTIGDLAEYLNCTTRAVYKLIHREKLGEAQGFSRPFGREYRVDIPKFLRARGMNEPTKMPARHEEMGPLIREVLGNLMPLHTQLSHIAAGVTQLGEDIKRMQRAWEKHEYASSNHTPHRKRSR